MIAAQAGRKTSQARRNCSECRRGSQLGYERSNTSWTNTVTGTPTALACAARCGAYRPNQNDPGTKRQSPAAKRTGESWIPCPLVQSLNKVTPLSDGKILYRHRLGREVASAFIARDEYAVRRSPAAEYNAISRGRKEESGTRRESSAVTGQR